MRCRRVFAVLTSLLLLACAAAGRDFQADLVLVNGKVITVDAADSIAEALAILGPRIIAVGSNAEVRKLIGPGTRVVDLQGMTATPGLIDSHAHFSGTDLLYELDLSYPAVKRIDDVLAKVKAAVSRAKPGEWIRGRGWDEGKLAELRCIYASDLDRAAPANPVWLTQTMGHYGAANSLALKLAGIGKGTPDPPAGTIDRSLDGTPTGVLKESAQSMVSRLLPPFTREQEENGLRKIVEEFNKEGMTGVKDPGIGPDKWSSYQRLLSRGELNVRVFVLWSGGRTVQNAEDLVLRIAPFTRPYISTGDDHLISGGVKLYMDGSGGARTAWLYNEWNRNSKDTDRGNFGYPVIEPDIFRQMIRIFHEAGLHVSTHAIGDRAIDWVVDSYAQALEQKPTPGLRHGIIHCNIPTDRAINLMAALQKKYDSGYPEAQSTFTWWIGDTYAGNFGPERSLRLMPFKTYLTKGLIWSGGSDFSVTPFAARCGIWASIVRTPLQGAYGSHPFGSAESVDVHAALRSYTNWAARQMFLENKVGSLEAGKYADVAVWDKDLYSAETGEIKNLECQMTVFNGKVVYEAPGTRLRVSEPVLRK
jgi:predicted amidohydrolase YtcJ